MQRITITVDDDETGRRNADELGERLLARGVREVRQAFADGKNKRAAA